MVDDKQFIITPPHLACKIIHANLWSNNQIITLSNGYELHFHQDLKVITNETNSVVLLGNAWQVTSDTESPVETVKTMPATADYKQMIEYEKYWCGRYLLIVNGKIMLDLTGSLGVFYDENFVSSSLNILCKVNNASIKYPNIKWGGIPDYVPGPMTPYNSTRRLLPSQILEISTKGLAYRKLLPDVVFQGYKDDVLISKIEQSFCVSAQNMRKEFSDADFWLALTGGRDSRLTMSLLELANIDYKTFTCWNPHITTADIDLPYVLSELAGRRHVYIPRKENALDENKAKDYDEHTAGMAVDTDRNYYIYGQYQRLIKNRPIAILRSGVVELTCKYLMKAHNLKNVSKKEAAFAPCLVYPSPYPEKYIAESFDSWEAIAKGDKENQDMSLWDRMYLELRCGSWLSSIEQSYDVMDNINSIQIWNCRYFMSLLMGFKLSHRIYNKHEEMICNHAYPQFKRIPYDYNSTIKKRVKYFFWKAGVNGRIKKVISFLK